MSLIRLRQVSKRYGRNQVLRDVFYRLAPGDHRVIEIQNHRFHEYDCGFVEFVRRKRGKTRQLEREFRHEEELLAFEAEAIQDRREAARNPSRALARRLADIRKRQAPREVDTIVTGIYRGMRTADQFCEVTQLSKRYDGQTLFDDLDFTLHRGDKLVVVGPNGCGKTTLLRVLRNEVAPDQATGSWSSCSFPRWTCSRRLGPCRAASEPASPWPCRCCRGRRS